MQGEAAARGSSGALLAAVTAAYATGSFVSLRADSAGDAPAPAALVVGGLVLGLLLWPLAARTTRVVTLTAVLAAAQIGASTVTLAASGSLAVHGARGIVCCPPTPTSSSGPFAALTAQAGWWLFAAQMLACLLLALLLRGARQLVDTALDALLDVRELLGAPLRGLLAALRAIVPAVPVGPAPRRWERADSPPLAGLVLARTTARRGPPARPARSRAHPAPLVLA
ncbi:hypothetical protein [Motilibacter deserti]|uniref:Uncharacterized protein n=1 Tax=Motilibacter deserti TaxID=2714956 RepID=A0ABX0GZR9_9ACTN|nr:hypothetical protein [Motilibacter deserti]NHC15606.1 hypothetical protein [Motilibacter deserti]